MIRYGYFEDDENTYLGKKNQELSNTKRYQRIHQIFAQKDITDVDQILSKTKISGEKISDALKHTLQSDEKKDLVLRMLYIFGIELGAEGFQLRQEYDVEQKPSLLELVCVVCLMNKANFEKIFGETQYYCSFKAVCVKLNCGELKFNIDGNCIKNKTFYHKYVFEKINTFFAVEQKSPGIEDLEDNNLKKQIELINNLITYYKIARFVSKTEYVIKDWSNQLIHNYNNLTGKYDIDGNVYCNYRKYLKDYLSAEEEMNFVISKLGVIKKENQQVGEKLEQLQAFIDMVKNENYHGAQHLVWNMRFSSTHVKENREFDMKELNMYVNTFRWEYRPQPSEENKWKEREMCKQSKQDGKKKLESKCASYFIYELFFE